MVDYFSEMIPDIWMADPVPALSSLPDSMLLHNYNRNIPPPTGKFGSSILTGDYSADRLSSENVRSTRQARSGAEVHQDLHLYFNAQYLAQGCSSISL